MTIEVRGVSYSYGTTHALSGIDLTIPDGTLCALLGRNGSGKTTLLQILMGLRRPGTGTARIFGKDVTNLAFEDRASIGYIAEGQPLPGWMRVQQVIDYLSPLYPTWDSALAGTLRERFELDPARKIKTLSRGEQMKAALLCALAPRPKVLIMDEPFTGMDAIVKDELIRGLLESSGSEGWTVILCSHDIGELEMLADSVAILERGKLVLSETMDAIRDRYPHTTLRDVFVAVAKREVTT
jgi:ABC-2 type transport system ATP-binding protein